ncbi:hypothetical protein [Thalassotalea hakodatensis]|uniref:hypothetical protein n=1 Tax=Thalassotalea hakodatensis TaxID=3030492 RepID=UPI0025748F38|nr:hypothetical protein [Thalassotalea hakodatensis]
MYGRLALVLCAVTVAFDAQSNSLHKSKLAFDKLIKVCDPYEFVQNESNFENTLAKEISKLDTYQQEQLLYKESESRVLLSYFGIPYLDHKVKGANHLKTCWAMKYEITLRANAKAKLDAIDKWYSSTQGVHNTELELLKKYYSCHKDSLK